MTEKAGVQLGDTVKILETHQGFNRGRTGKVYGFTKDGRAVVRMGARHYAHVQLKNLEVLKCCNKI